MSLNTVVPSSRLEEHPLVQTLKRIDPFLIFLTKKSGLTSVPLATLAKALPPVFVTNQTLQDIQELVNLGILHWHHGRRCSDSRSNPPCELEEILSTWDDVETTIGFPLADSPDEDAAHTKVRQGIGSLHGSTKTGFKRRLKALLQVLKEHQQALSFDDGEPQNPAKEKSGAASLRLEDEAEKIICLSDRCLPEGSSIDTSDIPNISPDKDCVAFHIQPPPQLLRTTQKRQQFDDDDDDLLMECEKKEEHDTSFSSDAAEEALRDLERLLGFSDNKKLYPAASSISLKTSTTAPVDTCSSSSEIPTRILDAQASYAGSHPAQQSAYEDLSEHTLEQIPLPLLQAFGLVAQEPSTTPTRRLYRHQTRAIEAALAEKHFTVCTGTGSGKSMCYLLPVLIAAYGADRVSFILYPTKALAQDQLTQLQSLLADSRDPSLVSRVRPAVLDGDTPHSTRTLVANSANVILTNPDTLHAGILPQWRHLYKGLLSRLSYIVLDEAHLYEGVFGAHVAMILSRLVRVCVAAANKQGLPPVLPTFLATSATLSWPEETFRGLCPVGRDVSVVVVDASEDGSPRSAKHFFVWNPPLLRKADNASTGEVCVESSAKRCCTATNVAFVEAAKAPAAVIGAKRKRPDESSLLDRLSRFVPCDAIDRPHHRKASELATFRRHAADETALLLARALINGVRCIAFCKTRNLVEWVYERTIAALKRSTSSSPLVDKLESYRGGYSKQDRREIERKLFRGALLGVVGTSALELGVDIGGVDLTLHCGYPSSYSSLLQQAGRAGRSKDSLACPSCSVVVCFDSPNEQHMWRHPKSLLSRGVSPSCTIPVTSGLVQGHLLCACEEFPLTKDRSICHVLGEDDIPCLSDRDLFGGIVFDEAFDELRSCLDESKVNLSDCSHISVYKSHVSYRIPWARVSIRAIEPVSYAIVNLSHHVQAGRTDGIHDQGAVMDTVPYSRVFYYSFPGAIIMHRGKRFQILSMTAPPAFAADNFAYRTNHTLAAFAKPTSAKYSTCPLSNLHITVVKAIHRVELAAAEASKTVSSADPESHNTAGAHEAYPCEDINEGESAVTVLSFAGCGTVTVKRRIHGYKKLSLITRQEISRSELALPQFEYDTFGVWFDVDMDFLLPRLGERMFGAGVHGLAHAILAVTPIFVPGVVRQDIDCDHSYIAPRRIMLFDERAGGSGACRRLWDSLFQQASILEAAIDLLDSCSTCSSDEAYDGGCPACLQSSNCLIFNLHLSRSAGAIVGQHLLERIKTTEKYRLIASHQAAEELTPRRHARRRALGRAKEMHAARHRQFVVGRPSWPLS